MGSTAALAQQEETAALVPVSSSLPTQASTPGDFSSAISSIRAGRWADARSQIDSMRDRDLAAFARSELFLAANSPRVDGSELQSLLSQAPTLPQAGQLARLASTRGVLALPMLPNSQRLVWAGSSPRRGNPRSVNDPGLGGLPRMIQERITNDDPAGAEAALTGAQGRLSSDALTEWRYRVAWSYYIENDDMNARRVASMAQSGSGPWLSMANWVQGLASWRTSDCRAAMEAFRNAASQATDEEQQAAGYFWYARSATACREPEQAQPAYRRAARLGETFYGQLANEMLGTRPALGQSVAQVDTRRVSALPNVRAAMALVAMGESNLADQTLRHQARIGPSEDYNALLAMAARLNLPETQLYLAHNTPGGARPDVTARYPVPGWTPASGWRVEPALVFAHSLQESQFRRSAVSPAGAVGLMQVRPGTASYMGHSRSNGSLTDPATNLDLGQNYIEYLRDNAATGGMLPKVIAAYNAGPTPIARWNSEVRDGGDPLLYIESIPYWETRAYVGIVLRNLWVYEQQMGQTGQSRADLAGGKWPTVPRAQQTNRRGTR
jgi:soluble lytic murein transglycosylase-like protein